MTAEGASVQPLAIVLGLVVGSPLVIVALHAIVHRALDGAGHRQTAHASAFVAILGTLAVLLGATWWLAVPAGTSLGNLVCTLAYVTAVFAGLAVLYVDVVNVAETSLHMHLLLELAWGGGVRIADLHERYSAERMIAVRLERLSGIGQLRIADGRCYILNRSALRFNACIDLWRKVLGLPTDPSESESASLE
jgi:hypothetical protein